MASELKDFLYVGAMQGHSIIHDGMNSKQYSSSPDGQQIIWQITDASASSSEQRCELLLPPLGVAATHSSNTGATRGLERGATNPKDENKPISLF